VKEIKTKLQIMAEMKEILDRAAGREHTTYGRVMQTLEELLGVYREHIMEGVADQISNLDDRLAGARQRIEELDTANRVYRIEITQDQAALARVNEHLKAFGIAYPQGSRGVADLIQMYRGLEERLAEVTQERDALAKLIHIEKTTKE